MNMKADILITNVAFLDQHSDAIAIKDGLILAIGFQAGMGDILGPSTIKIDGKGAHILPGFVESHVHLFTGGVALNQLNVAEVFGEAELTRAISAFDLEQGGTHLLQAYGANYTILGETRPTRQDLDRIMPHRPLAITSTDVHCAWVNTKALELAGILNGADPALGAQVVMGEDGLATGELREFTAMGLVLNLGLSGGREQFGLCGTEPENVTMNQREVDKSVLTSAMIECARLGITRAVNMDGNFYLADLLVEMEAEGRLPIRVSLPFVLTTQSGLEKLDAIKSLGAGSKKLRFGRVKMFMDGVFDTWTAFVTDHYPDRPEFTGEALFSAQEFNAICVEADRLHLQIAVHAVGDGAVRRVLDGYECAQKANGRRDSRHRIEHIDTIHKDDLARLTALGVIASMQPVHPPGSAGLPLEPTISLMGRNRWHLAFPWKRIDDLGVPIAFGTDWPVSPLDPLHAIHCALTRKPWAEDIPDQRLSLSKYLHAYSSAGNYADFSDKYSGTLDVGMAADIVLLEGNLEALAGPAQYWPKVTLTICDGVIIYNHKEPYHDHL